MIELTWRTVLDKLDLIKIKFKKTKHNTNNIKNLNR